MEYKKLISITGMGGLFEIISSKKDGAIVKSLETGVTNFVSSRLHNFSHLESIEVYTTTDNVNLATVFMAMQKSAEPRPDDKDAAAVKKYFEKVYPDMDFERVYNSDMKKMVKWLGILENNNVQPELMEEGEEAVEEVKEAAKPKAIAPKVGAVKNAPAKKINAPRKMA